METITFKDPFIKLPMLIREWLMPFKKDILNGNVVTSEPDFFSRKHYSMAVKPTQEILYCKSNIESLFKEYRNYKLNDQLEFVKKYILFLKAAEHIFFKRNGEEEVIYSEQIENKFIFYMDLEDYKVRIQFEKSTIKNPAAGNIALSMIMGTKDESMVEFVTMDIKRKHGKLLTDTYRFISNENVNFERLSDTIIVERVMDDIIKYIELDYKYFIEKFFEDYYSDNIEWEGIICNGLWIRTS